MSDIEPRESYSPIVPTENTIEDLQAYIFEELMQVSRVFGDIILERPWHELGSTGEPAFLNGWNNAGGVYELAAFRLLVNNSLVFKGVLTAGTITDGTILFTLPEGYRPAQDVIIPTVAQRAANVWDASILLRILQNGNVTIYGAGGTTVRITINSLFFLDN